MDTLVPVNTGALSEALIYLVVLRDGRGICTVCRSTNVSIISLIPFKFHFTDISGPHRIPESSVIVIERTPRSPRSSKGEGSFA